MDLCQTASATRTLWALPSLFALASIEAWFVCALRCLLWVAALFLCPRMDHDSCLAVLTGQSYCQHGQRSPQSSRYCRNYSFHGLDCPFLCQLEHCSFSFFRYRWLTEGMDLPLLAVKSGTWSGQDTLSLLASATFIASSTLQYRLSTSSKSDCWGLTMFPSLCMPLRFDLC